MQVKDVIAAVDRLAPFDLAEPWDHVGLQVGSPGDELPPAGTAGSGSAAGSAGAAPVVLVALEADDSVLDEARRLGAAVAVSHHPLIFDPLERLSDDSLSGRLALRAAREGVAVIAAHTSLDKARGGIADVIAELLGIEAAAPLAPAAADALKLVGFVPADDADLVRKAVFAAGAGVIGEYEHCSWSTGGQGTFFGREGTDPAAGQAGRDETVDELRLEVVFPRRLRRRVIGAYVAAHPYEEPAYDVIPLENEVASLGLGRLGVLPAATTLAAFAAQVAAVLRLASVRYAGDAGREMRRVAVLPGSGAEAIARGVAQVADVLVTGDVKYHEARAAQAQGLALIDAPHGVTEQEGVLRWAERLAAALGAEATVETFRNPTVLVCERGLCARVAGGRGRRTGRPADILRRASRLPRPEPGPPTTTTTATTCTRTAARVGIPALPGSARASSPPTASSSRSSPTRSVRRPTTSRSTRRSSPVSRSRSTGGRAPRRVPRQRAGRAPGERPVQGQGRGPEAAAPSGLPAPQPLPRGRRQARAARAERRRGRTREPGDRRRDRLTAAARRHRDPASAAPRPAGVVASSRVQRPSLITRIDPVRG